MELPVMVEMFYIWLVHYGSYQVHVAIKPFKCG